MSQTQLIFSLNFSGMDPKVFSLPSLFLLLFFLYKVFKLIKSKNGTTKKLPPGPFQLPVIGSLHHLSRENPHRGLTELAKKFGPLMHIQLGEVPLIVISSPEVAKDVLKTHDITFASRPEILVSKIMFYNNTDLAFAPYGDYWRQIRKICIVELLSVKRVKSYAYIRENEAFKMMESIRASAGEPVNLADKLLVFMNSVICRAAFGKKGTGQDKLLDLMKETIVFQGGFHVSDLFPSYKLLHYISGMKPKLEKMHKAVDELLHIFVTEHQKHWEATKKGSGESGEEDLIDVLLRVMESGDLQFPITLDNIKAIIYDIFAGGTETSSTTTEWALSALIKNPRVMAKAQAEVREALKGKTEITENDIQGLKYLKLVIKEVLRLHPPLPLLVPRVCREECEISGYTIPEKAKVIINYWSIGKDPKYWQDADKFIPERFDEDSLDFAGTHCEYIPFGAGRRICPGINFGLASLELPLAQLLYHFDWKLPNGMKPEDLDMTETVGITASRKNSLVLIPTPYNP